jgi:hypothetical protein
VGNRRTPTSQDTGFGILCKFAKFAKFVKFAKFASAIRLGLDGALRKRRHSRALTGD